MDWFPVIQISLGFLGGGVSAEIIRWFRGRVQKLTLKIVNHHLLAARSEELLGNKYSNVVEWELELENTTSIDIEEFDLKIFFAKDSNIVSKQVSENFSCGVKTIDEFDPHVAVYRISPFNRKEKIKLGFTVANSPSAYFNASIKCKGVQIEVIQPRNIKAQIVQADREQKSKMNLPEPKQRQ